MRQHLKILNPETLEEYVSESEKEKEGNEKKRYIEHPQRQLSALIMSEPWYYRPSVYLSKWPINFVIEKGVLFGYVPLAVCGYEGYAS